jgi:hypothetical protein
VRARIAQGERDRLRRHVRSAQRIRKAPRRQLEHLGEFDCVCGVQRTGLARPPSWRSVAGPGRCPSGKRDDGASGGAHVGELQVFQGELVDCADEGGKIGPELGELLVLRGDRLLQPGDGGAEPGLVFVIRAFSLMRWQNSFFRSVWRWVSALRRTSASMARATIVSAPLDPPPNPRPHRVLRYPEHPPHTCLPSHRHPWQHGYLIGNSGDVTRVIERLRAGESPVAIARETGAL